MEQEELEKINRVARTILRRLYDDKKIGESHTAEEHLKKGIPPEFQKYTGKAIKWIKKEGFIIPKKTNYGMHVSLNPKQIPKIEKMLGIEP